MPSAARPDPPPGSVGSGIASRRKAVMPLEVGPRGRSCRSSRSGFGPPTRMRAVRQALEASHPTSERVATGSRATHSGRLPQLGLPLRLGGGELGRGDVELLLQPGDLRRRCVGSAPAGPGVGAGMIGVSSGRSASSVWLKKAKKR